MSNEKRWRPPTKAKNVTNNKIWGWDVRKTGPYQTQLEATFATTSKSTINVRLVSPHHLSSLTRFPSVAAVDREQRVSAEELVLSGAS